MRKESGVESWKSETTAFDRVQSVAMGLDTPTAAGDIAVSAHVAENTARSHLTRLSDLDLLQSASQDGTTVYYPDPLYTRMRTLREVLNEHNHSSLMELQASLQERIETWSEEYDVDEPGELRKKSSVAETSGETRSHMKTASDWELTLYRLSVISEAIKNYEMYTQSPLDNENGVHAHSPSTNTHSAPSYEAVNERIGEELESSKNLQ